MNRPMVGTPQHQAVIQAITAFYADDPRILSVCLFGSLARGNWDQFSDLDLDVIIADDIEIDLIGEIEQLCRSLARIGERAALILADGSDAGDVVLESLLEFSIRYHRLGATNWKIVDSLLLLSGNISLEAIKEAGQANYVVAEQPLTVLVDRYLRYALGVNIRLERHQIWTALELLHRMRGLLIEMFARTRGHQRALQAFDNHANPYLRRRLAGILSTADLPSIRMALNTALDVAEIDLAALTDGQVQLSLTQHKFLSKLRIQQEKGKDD